MVHVMAARPSGDAARTGPSCPTPAFWHSFFFLGNSRFPFYVPFVPSPLLNLRKVIALASVDPAICWCFL